MAEDDLTFMTGFNLWVGGREIGLSATLHKDGWVAAFEENNKKELQGRFFFAERSIVFEINRDLLGEARVLRWIAGAVLTKTDPNPLVVGHDLVPNDGNARHGLHAPAVDRPTPR